MTGRTRCTEDPVVPRIRTALGAVLIGFVGLLGLTVVVLTARHGSVLPIDRAAHIWSLHRRPAALVTVAWVVTATGTGVFPYAAAVAAGLIAGRDIRHRLAYAAGALAFLLLGQALRFGLMETVGRPRPAVGDWATHASGFAFPSGHATTSALMAGLLVAAIGHRARLRRARAAASGTSTGAAALAVLLGCWAAAVGVSRVLLGVHWATDVVAGWLFAAVWLGLGATLIRIRTASPASR
ncbi:phosphatase PAP2 family protein [Streptomyces sp. NBC_01800]|uniref:phosphatase PAP2 family protein n=1 Tax=Streptomyces sp. NBC_01800 TaxID=2975945 RepID=UPI002DDB79F4|nr:phosphatase PAP2 family protein [Streptomyces sp. NBC_01800]WSA66402.1 phosphatase PAP2 family protein [Streptomyces sp. NBC_01800]